MSSMTPSATGITDGQIDKVVSVLRDQLRKHGGQFSVDAVQQVLGQDELGSDLLTVFRKRVEVVSNRITRRISVKRNRTPQDMLDATGRNQHTDKGVVKSMPRGTGDETEVIFFKVGRYINDADLDKEYDLRGLKPADPFSLGAVNEADQAFAEEHPNGTHWQDANGKWCHASFDRWDDGPGVSISRINDDWYGQWWFAGVRKQEHHLPRTEPTFQEFLDGDDVA